MDRDNEFELYVSSAFARLCRTGFLLCGDWQRAEDAVQETLLRMYAAWHRIERREGLDAYARRAVTHRLIDEHRRPWRRRESTSDDLERHDAAAVDEIARADDRDALVRAVAALTPRRRACIVLRFYDDASVADTARALGCSEGNVKRMTSDALAALRCVLDQTERTPS